MAMIACTIVVVASNATTTNMNGAIGQPSNTVVRACACRVCAKMNKRWVRIAKKNSSSSRTKHIEPCREAPGDPAREDIDLEMYAARCAGRQAGGDRDAKHHGDDFVQTEHAGAGEPAHQHVGDGDAGG